MKTLLEIRSNSTLQFDYEDIQFNTLIELVLISNETKYKLIENKITPKVNLIEDRIFVNRENLKNIIENLQTLAKMIDVIDNYKDAMNESIQEIKKQNDEAHKI